VKNEGGEGKKWEGWVIVYLYIRWAVFGVMSVCSIVRSAYNTSLLKGKRGVREVTGGNERARALVIFPFEGSYDCTRIFICVKVRVLGRSGIGLTFVL